VEGTVETAGATQARLQIRLLGPLTVLRATQSVPLPASRKVRALLAYLALHPAGATRAQLCDLLWDVPNDPRGELRWSLSKLRGVVDDAERRRVVTSEGHIALDLSDVFVDALAVDTANVSKRGSLPLEQLRSLATLFQGEFLDGLQIDSAPFTGWLHAQRHRYRTYHLGLLEQIVQALPCDSDERMQHLQTWLQVAPFDRRAHEIFMFTLAENGRVTDAEAHLTAAIHQFETEGLDWLPLRESWRAARGKYAAHAAIARTSTLATRALDPVSPATPRRASIAVMPFVDRTGSNTRGGLADGITEDIITGLAKLRAFFVIARGSAFALEAHDIDPHEAGRILNVDYVVSGSVRRRDQRITVAVELADARTACIQWTEQFESKLDATFELLDDIKHRIVAAIVEEIEITERNRALLKPPTSLDAWESYHRGLWHMYNFNAADNERAEHFFRTAVRLDPTFARAHAGLSFIHFQNAFLHRVSERAKQIDLAFAAAGQSLMVDDRDPAAHWAMGRALWLRGRQEESLQELERCVDLSPNFALGHYMLAFVHSQTGDARKSIEAADYSRRLSPFDPLQFGMLASRAMAQVRLGQVQEAAEWAVRAATRPNAHIHILGIAALCLAVANRLEEARSFAKQARQQQSSYSVHDWLSAFRFEPEAAELFRRSAERIGFT
jgi:TolB-like protein/Flp pilus assembly protein TadD